MTTVLLALPLSVLSLPRGAWLLQLLTQVLAHHDMAPDELARLWIELLYTNLHHECSPAVPRGQHVRFKT